jgi:hypothetical protein
MHPSDAPGQLWTAAQLGRRWQGPTSHVYRLAREGLIPSVRLGRYVRFQIDVIEAFERDGRSSRDLRI